MNVIIVITTSAIAQTIELWPVPREYHKLLLERRSRACVVRQ